MPSREGQVPRSQLTKEQLASYDRDGFLLLKAKDVWTDAEIKLIKASVDAMGTWPDAPGKYMKVRRQRTPQHSAQRRACSRNGILQTEHNHTNTELCNIALHIEPHHAYDP